jgi:hypothetical protein
MRTVSTTDVWIPVVCEGAPYFIISSVSQLVILKYMNFKLDRFLTDLLFLQVILIMNYEIANNYDRYYVSFLTKKPSLNPYVMNKEE